MSDDLDTRLSSLAPGVRPRDEFRQNLRMVLRSHAPAEAPQVRPRSQPRHHRVLALIAAMFVLTLVVGESGQELGSFDFELVPALSPGSGDTVLSNELGTMLFRPQPGVETEVYEEVFALEAAGIHRLVSVTGWTVGSTTSYVRHFVYEVDGETVTISDLEDESPEVMTKEMISFLMSRAEACLAAVDEGRARALLPETINIAGQPVTMHKWHVTAADGTEAIYWEGSPE